MMSIPKLFFSCLALLAFSFSATHAQQGSGQTLSLDDMSSFKDQAGNWFIVGDVAMDPTIDVHPEKAPRPESKRRKKRNAPVPPQAVAYQPGTGILLNMNDDTKKDPLITKWEHGDMELSFDVMLPKGSNSGVYLQGRYEVQLMDSWDVKNAKFSDMGGIYRNWEREEGKSYMGKAPLANAAKAPGLWQHMKIAFQAPRFNDRGEKVSNAKFVSVELNGVKIHDNVEVPLPTGGPINKTETAMGPLMIQGDHGPVALRHIRYTILNDVKIPLSELNYKTFEGKFDQIKDFETSKPTSTGKIPELTYEVAGVDDAFGVIYTGNVTIPADGTYQFRLDYNGGVRLIIDGKTIIDAQQPNQRGGSVKGSVTLAEGTYPLEIAYIKNVSWLSPRLGFFDINSFPTALHAFNSFPPDGDVVPPIYVKVGNRPTLLRAFLDYEGNRGKRLTHTIGVGDPGGVHYIYDVQAGNLVAVWKGDFVDATPMWHDRGDGSFKPMGMVQYLTYSPPMAVLNEANTPFPEKASDKNFRSKGYIIDATGKPTFKYLFHGMEVEDKVYPDEKNNTVTREVHVKGAEAQPNLSFKIAEAKDIQAMAGGRYIIGDNAYYIQLLSASKPLIREVNGQKELVSAINGEPLKYSIIW